MREWPELELFVRVAQRRSFALAAKEVGLTPSAMSKAVARLERAVGAPLLKRSTRRVALTPTGAELLDETAPILAQLALVRRRFQGDRQPEGRLAIDLPISLGPWLVSRLPSLVARYPELRLEVRVNDAFVDLLSDAVDVAVRIGAVSEGPLIARPLATTSLQLYASPAYLAARGTPTSIEELRGHACLLFRSANTGQRMAWRFKGSASVRPDSVATFNSGEALADAAAAGLGVAQLFEVTARPRLSAGTLVSVLAPLGQGGIPISLVYPAQSRSSPNVKAFSTWLGQAAREL
jgi:LysR family transcriptional regulator, regulator for bpeEF and oprC